MTTTTTRPSLYTRETLARALADSASLRGVVGLGLEDSAYRRRYVSRNLREYGLDHSRLRGSHFKYTPELLTEAATAHVD